MKSPWRHISVEATTDYGKKSPPVCVCVALCGRVGTDDRRRLLCVKILQLRSADRPGRGHGHERGVVFWPWIGPVASEDIPQSRAHIRPN